MDGKRGVLAADKSARQVEVSAVAVLALFPLLLVAVLLLFSPLLTFDGSVVAVTMLVPEGTGSIAIRAADGDNNVLEEEVARCIGDSCCCCCCCSCCCKVP